MAYTELVIKIPDRIHYGIEKGITVNGSSASQIVLDAVKDGTPLPKGHGDLIDANRKITVSTYDEQYEEWGEETMTVCEALNKWSDEGVTVKDVVIPADDAGNEVNG